MKILQIGFHIRVLAGASPKAVALKAVKSAKATWVVLDRLVVRIKNGMYLYFPAQ